MRKVMFIITLFVSLKVSYSQVLQDKPAEKILHEDVYIDTAYFRSIGQFDNGSLHVFIANNSQAAVNLTEISVNNIPVDRLDDDTFLWYQVVPPYIAPGQVAEVIVKFFRLSDKNKPLDVKIVTNNGKVLKRQVETVPNPLLITYVGFSNDLMNVYIYLENNADRELTIKDIYLHTEKVTKISYIPENKIKPGRRSPVIIHLLSPLIQGGYVTVKITTDNDTVCQNIVRAFSRFPVTFEDGSVAQGTYLDPDEFYLSNSSSKEQLLNTNGRLPARILERLGCPMHAHGSLKVASRKIANLIQETRQTLPRYLSCIGICRYDKEWSYFIFGQITDCIKINPNQVSTSFQETARIRLNHDSAGLRHMRISQWLTELARKGGYPRPLYTSPVATKNSPYYTYRYPTAEELRLMTYYEISGGTKGIMYRSDSWHEMQKIDKRLADEFRNINAELQVLKRFLEIGEPIDLAKSNNPLVLTNTILAADRAIILILINEDMEIDYNSIQKPFVYQPKYKFRVEVKIPDWMKIEDVYQVGGTYPRLDYSSKGNVITIPISRLDITAQIVLTTDPNDYIYDQDKDGLSDIDEIVSYKTDIFKSNRGW